MSDDKLDKLVSFAKQAEVEAKDMDRANLESHYITAVTNWHTTLNELDKALEIASCGHPAACVKSDDEGTKRCGWCVAESEANRLRADLAREKSKLKCAFAYSEGLERELKELHSEIASLETCAGTDPLGKILNMISAELEGFAIAGEPINMAVRRLRKMVQEGEENP